MSQLREELARLEVGDARLVSFKDLPVMSHGFFPGGNGLYEGIDAIRLPVGGTLVLGSNFGCYNRFVSSEGQLVILDERGSATWVSLLTNLRPSGIVPEECFFTNAWPFLHRGDSNLGRMIREWLTNRALMKSCIGFFEYTVMLLRPKLVIALGTGPAAFLSRVWPESLGPWKARSWRRVDELPIAAIDFHNRILVCVATTHPSMTKSNLKHRRAAYHNEVQLLAQARLKSATATR